MDIPPNDDFSINQLFAWLIPTAGLLGGYWKYIDNKFREKKLEAERLKEEREEFITKVAEKAVQAAINATFGGFRKDVDTLFRYREEDRKHLDTRLDSIMKELKK